MLSLQLDVLPTPTPLNVYKSPRLLSKFKAPHTPPMSATDVKKNEVYIFQKQYQHLIRDTSRRSLALARSNRNALLAKKKFCYSQIEEAEEYIGLLRQECALLDMELVDADNEVNGLKGVLIQKVITESSLSDNEDDNLVPVCPPSSSNPSSNPIMGGSGASSSSSDSYPFHYGSDDNLPSDDEIEVVGECVSETNNEGGIGRPEMHLTVKGEGN